MRTLALVAALLSASGVAFGNEVACTSAGISAERARMNECTADTAGTCTGGLCVGGGRGALTCPGGTPDCDCTAAGKTMTFSCAASCAPFSETYADPNCVIYLNEWLDAGECVKSAGSNASCCDTVGGDGVCSTAECGDPAPTSSGTATGTCCVVTDTYCDASDPGSCTSADAQCTGASVPWHCCTGDKAGTCCGTSANSTSRRITVPNVTIDGGGKVTWRQDPCCWHRKPEFGSGSQSTDVNGWTRALDFWTGADNGRVTGLRIECFWEGVNWRQGIDNGRMDGFVGWHGCDDSASIISEAGVQATGHIWSNSVFVGGTDKCIQIDANSGGTLGAGVFNLTTYNVKFTDCNTAFEVDDSERVRAIRTEFACTGQEPTTGNCYEPWYDSGTGKGIRDTYVSPTGDYRACGDMLECSQNGGFTATDSGRIWASGSTTDFITNPVRLLINNSTFVSEGCNLFKNSSRYAVYANNNALVKLSPGDRFMANGNHGAGATGESAVYIFSTADVDAGGGTLDIDGSGNSTGAVIFGDNNKCNNGVRCDIYNTGSGTNTAIGDWYGGGAPGKDNQCPPNGGEFTCSTAGSLDVTGHLTIEPKTCGSRQRILIGG